MRPSSVLAIVKKLTGGKAWNKPWGIATPATAKKNRAAARGVEASNWDALRAAAAREPAQPPRPAAAAS